MKHELELSFYQNFSQVEELLNTKNIEYHYLSLSLEISLRKILNDQLNTLQEFNIYHPIYLLIEKYTDINKQELIEVNFSSSRSFTQNWNDDLISLERLRSLKSKKILINDMKIELHKEYGLLLDSQYPTLLDAFNFFITEKVEPTIKKIKPFLIFHKVSYDDKLLNDFIENSLKFTKEIFSISSLKTCFEDWFEDDAGEEMLKTGTEMGIKYLNSELNTNIQQKTVIKL